MKVGTLASVSEALSLIKQGLNNKSAIRIACLQVIENPNAKPREKLQAASILEKLMKHKDLASARKAKKAVARKSQHENLADLLSRVSAA